MRPHSPFTVQAFCDDDRFADNLSFHSMRQTLRLAAELAGGVPCAWVGIRKGGKLVAELATNWRGELSEANMHADYGRYVVVTPLNVHGPIFANIFAK